MRSGDPDIYRMARAMSRHSMDVDNTHWPRPRWYRGDTNASLDWFEHEMQAEISPYVGIGRRHASQQWISKLSAHVWVQGWLASRSEEHTSELQSRGHLVCRLLLEESTPRRGR